MKKIGLLSSVAAFAAFAPGAVFAQDEADAQAASSNATDNAIIVTARRVEERLQDVPISMTVFNQEQISNNNIVTATDLGTVTPSLRVNQQYGNEKASFVIRGFQQDNSTAPTVGVYFADVVQPRAQGGTLSGGTLPPGAFMDIENVQVLKGPQGTLFGRNTTGGAVLVVPKKPTDRLEGYVEGSAGNYDMLRGQMVLNVPLADTFKVRVALDRNKRDGYMKNVSGIGPKDYNDVNYFAGRLSILAELTPNLENYLVGVYSNSFTNGYGQVVGGPCDPSKSVFVSLPACDQIDRQEAREDGPLTVDITHPNPFIKLRQWQVINTTTWQANDNLTIKNVASYSEFREASNWDLYAGNLISRFDPSVAPFLPFPHPDGVPFQFLRLAPGASGNNAAQSTITEELQFQGLAAGGRLTWQAGGYMEISNPIGFNSGYTGILLDCSAPDELACTNPFGVGQIADSRTRFWFRDYALYAQATYEITDQLALTGGFRYTWSTTKGEAFSTLLSGPGFTTRTCSDRFHFNGGDPTIPLVVNSPDECSFAPPAEKSNEPTWLINLDYKPIEDVLIFAKYARGYRSGGQNLTAVGIEGWKPEFVDDFEVGVKASFGMGNVRGNLALTGFYEELKDMQLAAVAVSVVPGVNSAGPEVNGGKGRMQGIEFDGNLRIGSNLRLNANYSYLDAKLVSINLPSIPAGTPYAPNLIISTAEGSPLPLAPKNQFTLGANYTLPLDASVGDITIGVSFIHTDKQVFDLGTVEQWRYGPATDLVNLNVNWTNVAGLPVDAGFFMTNLTNEKYPAGVSHAFPQTGYEGIIYAPPRMWGFRLRYNFGY